MYIAGAALVIFARFGYRETSMEAIAREARVSRPGPYFLFNSTDELFRAAVTQALEADLFAVEAILSDAARSLRSASWMLSTGGPVDTSGR
jgi:AcrR family transcriptional regulator